MPTRKDFVIGHEPMGIVEEVGPDVTKVKKGDRVVIPFTYLAGIVFIVKTSWRVNVTIQMITQRWILEDILAIQNVTAIIQEDKQNFYEYPMETSCLLLFPNPVN